MPKKYLASENDRLAEQLNSRTGAAAPETFPVGGVPAQRIESNRLPVAIAH
jgi:hypothetical protein